jgi:hypothetical protein
VLGTSLADSSGAFTYVARDLADGAHSFVAQTGSSQSSAVPITVLPDLTLFSPVNDTRGVTIDHSTYWVETANQPWSLNSPDTHTLRNELRYGDSWDGSSARTEISGNIDAEDTDFNVSYSVMVEPGEPIPTTSPNYVKLGRNRAISRQ